METLLSRSIPQLHAETLVLDVHGLGDEIDSDGGLASDVRTCSFPVKLSKMKRLMMEVLPTDWSPSSTILHFTAGLFYIFQIYVFYRPPHNKTPFRPTSYASSIVVVIV